MQGRTTYIKIADHLRVRIKSGILKNGDRLPSFQQLHRQFGAANSTVDKAYSALEVDGLIARRKRSGVFVAYTRPLVAAHRRLAIFGDYNHKVDTSHYWASLVQGIGKVAAEHGMETTYHVIGEEVNWDEYAGALYVSGTGESRGNPPPGFPIVFMLNHDPGNCFVWINDYDAGLIATRHLISLGHRRISFMGWIGTSHTEKRLAGYRAAFQDDDMIPDERFVFPMSVPIGLKKYTSEQVASTNMDAWLSEGFRRLQCTAIIAHNDWYALGVMERLRIAGYRIPDDISVIGFDNEPDGASAFVPLTSVSCDMFDLGVTAANTLLDRIAKPNAPVHGTILPVTLTQRLSTGPPPSAERRLPVEGWDSRRGELDMVETW